MGSALPTHHRKRAALFARAQVTTPVILAALRAEARELAWETETDATLELASLDGAAVSDHDEQMLCDARDGGRVSVAVAIYRGAIGEKTIAGTNDVGEPVFAEMGPVQASMAQYFARQHISPEPRSSGDAERERKRLTSMSSAEVEGELQDQVAKLGYRLVPLEAEAS